MYKAFVATSLLLTLILIVSCSGEKKSGGGRPQIINGSGSANNSKDSIVFYDNEIKAKIVSYKKELQGEWKIVSMRRQQKEELENLSGVSILFTADSSFNGKAPCNRIGGVYTLKGAGIIFSKIFSTKMACDKLEQESAMLRLLQETVSTFTVTSDKLLLRDGSANIVFECVR